MLCRENSILSRSPWQDWVFPCVVSATKHLTVLYLQQNTWQNTWLCCICNKTLDWFSQSWHLTENTILAFDCGKWCAIQLRCVVVYCNMLQCVILMLEPRGKWYFCLLCRILCAEDVCERVCVCVYVTVSVRECACVGAMGAAPGETLFSLARSCCVSVCLFVGVWWCGSVDWWHPTCIWWYGVVTISRLLQIIRLFCRM